MKRQAHFWMNVARIAGTVLIATLSLAAFGLPHAHAAPVAHAPAKHSASGTIITIEGVVSSIIGDTWVVGGVTITVTPQTVITGAPVVGNVVQVVAVPSEDNHLIAQTITLVALTATPGPSATPSDTPTATLTGTVGPSPTPSITPTATMTGIPGPSPTPVPFVIIVIEGPVQEINVNIIIVFGQRIKLRPDDPVLVKLKVGDWVHVDGDFEEESDNTIVVVVINIIIINPPPTVIIVAPPNNGGGDDDHHGHHEGD
ncbi:MAG: DUF5666 domain-containing protein [Aggregatilineales bacterium]